MHCSVLDRGKPRDLMDSPLFSSRPFGPLSTLKWLQQDKISFGMANSSVNSTTLTLLLFPNLRKLVKLLISGQ